MAWPKLPADRRTQVRRWLPAPQTERMQRRIALVAARLAANDGTTALELLDGLIPDHRPNKELQRLIVASLFSESKAIPFDEMAKAPAAPRVSTRVFSALASLAFDRVSGVEHMPRYLLSLAIVSLIVSQNLAHSSEGGDLLSKVTVEMERWPRGLREQFERWLTNSHPDLLSRFFTPTPTVVPTGRTEKAEGSQYDLAKANQSLKEDQPTVNQYLEQRARSLAAELEMLPTVRASLDENKSEVQRKLEGWKTRESELNQNILELQSTCTSLKNELSGATRQIKQLQDDLQSAQHQRDLEHEKLTHK